MKFKSRVLLLLAMLAFSLTANAQMLTGDHYTTGNGDLVIHPVNHATFVMEWDDKTIYVDPVGGVGVFDGIQRPDLILITDIHGDHLDAGTINSVMQDNTLIVAPVAVIDQLPDALKNRSVPIANGITTTQLDIPIEGIAMYNLTEERLQYHVKGRGNGYLATFGGVRVYISGDTEDIPEMRALEDIDVAFVCFNLPYTMTENQAASAVNEFRPAVVYPYHYQGSDLALFSSMVDDGIEVKNGSWY